MARKIETESTPSLLFLFYYIMFIYQLPFQ